MRRKREQMEGVTKGKMSLYSFKLEAFLGSASALFIHSTFGVFFPFPNFPPSLSVCCLLFSHQEKERRIWIPSSH